MILLKACPRCGGDLDATYKDDIYCVQCAYRPAGPAGVAARRLVGDAGTVLHLERAAASSRCDPPQRAPAPCPRCGAWDLVQLDRLRPRDNLCYRCRPCGHIFSPGTGEYDQRQRTGTE